MHPHIPNSAIVLSMQAQQLQQQLQQQDPAVSHKAALRIGEALTQKLIQLDNVQVTGPYQSSSSVTLAGNHSVKAAAKRLQLPSNLCLLHS